MYTAYEQHQEKSSHEHAASHGALSTTESSYRSSMSPRVTNIQRSRASGLGGSGVMTRVFQSIQTSGGGAGGFGSGLASLANSSGVPLRGAGGTSTALVGFNAARFRDKSELVQLNDKFAQYIEKVRFLEAQNRKLTLEIDALKRRSGQGSSRIKGMYETESAEAHKLIEETKRDADAAKLKTQRAEADVKQQRARYAQVSVSRETDRKAIDDLQRRLAENEAQIALFRRRIADVEDEARRYKAESQRLAAEIGRLQSDIQNELFMKSSFEVERVALEDELASAKQTHESNLSIIRSQNVSNDLDPAQFFRNELVQAIREIRGMFEAEVENDRSQAHNRYTLEYNEIIVRPQQKIANSGSNEQQRRQEDRIRSELLHSQSQTASLRASNEAHRNRIEDLQRKLARLREDNSQTQARLLKEIEAARLRLEQADRNYVAVTTLKTSLEKEIHDYRDLLESQNGLRGYVDRIEQSAALLSIDRPAANFGGGSSSSSISRTFINTGGSGFAAGGSSSFAAGGSSSFGMGSSFGTSGISTLASQSTRPTSSFQTGGSSTRTVVHQSSSSSGDFH